MNDPNKYIEGNSLQRTEAKDFLTEYFYLVQWRKSENIILDVGCGSGDVTSEILRPRLPEGTKIVGADVSPKMVQYTTEKYPNGSWIHLDIGDEKQVDNVRDKFDNIFSFHCLHWVKNQRQAMRNIYKLLKSGGGIFTYYISTSLVYDAYVIVGNMSQWKQYIDNPKKFHPVYHKDKNAITNLRNILDEVGFDTKVCKYVERLNTFPDRQSLSKFLFGINPFSSNIPNDMKQSYIEDIIDILFEMKEMKDLNDKGYQEIILPYYNNFIYATKPL